jgi:hypothetical protein
MPIGFTQKFNMSCCNKSLETFQHFWGISFQLVKAGPRNGKTHFKCSVVFMDHFQQQVIHRDVAFLSYFSHDASVAIVIPIMVILSDVKKAIGLDSEGLVYLEIKTNCPHGYFLTVS